MSAERDTKLQPAMVEDATAKEESKALDVTMLQYVIKVSLQGFDVVAESDTVETNPGVVPLHPHPITTEDEAIVDAFLA